MRQVCCRLLFDIVSQFCWPSQQPLTLDQSGLMSHLLKDVGSLGTCQQFKSSLTGKTFYVVIGYLSPSKSHSHLRVAAGFYSRPCTFFLCTRFLSVQLQPNINSVPLPTVCLMVITPSVYDRVI